MLNIQSISLILCLVMNLLCVLRPPTVRVDTFVLVGLTVSALVLLDQSLAVHSPQSRSAVVLVRF